MSRKQRGQQQSRDRRTDVIHGTSNSAAPPDTRTDINALAGAVASALQPLLESISGGPAWLNQLPFLQ